MLFHRTAYENNHIAPDIITQKTADEAKWKRLKGYLLSYLKSTWSGAKGVRFALNSVPKMRWFKIGTARHILETKRRA